MQMLIIYSGESIQLKRGLFPKLLNSSGHIITRVWQQFPDQSSWNWQCFTKVLWTPVRVTVTTCSWKWNASRIEKYQVIIYSNRSYDAVSAMLVFLQFTVAGWSAETESFFKVVLVLGFSCCLLFHVEISLSYLFIVVILPAPVCLPA